MYKKLFCLLTATSLASPLAWSRTVMDGGAASTGICPSVRAEVTQANLALRVEQAAEWIRARVNEQGSTTFALSRLEVGDDQLMDLINAISSALNDESQGSNGQPINRFTITGATPVGNDLLLFVSKSGLECSGGAKDAVQPPALRQSGSTEPARPPQRSWMDDYPGGIAKPPQPLKKIPGWLDTF